MIVSIERGRDHIAYDGSSDIELDMNTADRTDHVVLRLSDGTAITVTTSEWGSVTVTRNVPDPTPTVPSDGEAPPMPIAKETVRALSPAQIARLWTASTTIGSTESWFDEDERDGEGGPPPATYSARQEINRALFAGRRQLEADHARMHHEWCFGPPAL